MNFSKFGRVVRSLRMQLLLILLANVVFLILYRLFLKESVAEVVLRNDNPLNPPYYEAILKKLEFAGYLFSMILLIPLIFYRQVKRLVFYFSTREILFLGISIAILVSIQLCLISFVKTLPIYDSVDYLKLGNRLFMLHAYVNDAGTPSAYLPVGYPAFLAFLRFFSDNNLLFAKLANVGVSAALVVVTFRVFRGWLNPEERIVFILVTAFLPNPIFSSNVLLTDYPFTLLLWLAVLIFLQKPRSPVWFAVIGVLFAVMSYLRPVALLLPIVFLVSLWKDGGLRHHRLSLIVGGLVFVGVISPWIVRNYYVFGTFVPISTNAGYVFLTVHRAESSGGQDPDFSYGSKNGNEVAESAQALSLGLHYLVHNPIDEVKRLPKKIYYMYRRFDSSNTWTMKKTENTLDSRFVSSSFYFSNAAYYIILYLGLVALLLNALNKQVTLRNHLPTYLYAYSLLITLIFFGNERYLIPVMPIHQFLCAKFLSLRKGP